MRNFAYKCSRIFLFTIIQHSTAFVGSHFIDILTSPEKIDDLRAEAEREGNLLFFSVFAAGGPNLA